LYRKARRGEIVERPDRLADIYDFQITGREGADVRFIIRCSRGTYIRSIAHDLGEELGSGAHLVALRRTAIGPFQVDEAWTLQQLASRLAGTEGQ
jgi:tRNA pseudouridine55 synthase